MNGLRWREGWRIVMKVKAMKAQFSWRFSSVWRKNLETFFILNVVDSGCWLVCIHLGFIVWIRSEITIVWDLDKNEEKMCEVVRVRIVWSFEWELRRNDVEFVWGECVICVSYKWIGFVCVCVCDFVGFGWDWCEIFGVEEAWIVGYFWWTHMSWFDVKFMCNGDVCT